MEVALTNRHKGGNTIINRRSVDAETQQITHAATTVLLNDDGCNSGV